MDAGSDITLVAISADNYRVVKRLECDDTPYSRGTVYALAQSSLPYWHGYAVCVAATGEIVGFVSFSQYRARSGYAKINRVLIDRKWRGRGIGTAATTATVAKIHAIWPGCGIHIDVDVGNGAAISTYKKCGFETACVRKHYAELRIRPAVGFSCAALGTAS